MTEQKTESLPQLQEWLPQLPELNCWSENGIMMLYRGLLKKILQIKRQNHWRKLYELLPQQE